MKPLLAFSLLLNLCLLTALGYLLARSPEVVTETKEVVVTKTLNPNIDLETRVIALEAELEEAKTRYVEEVQAYEAERAQAEEVMETMKKGLLPPLEVPDSPRGFGKVYGNMQHKMLMLAKSYPTDPEKGTEAYDEYILQLDAVLQDFALAITGRREIEMRPETSRERQDYMIACLGATLALDTTAQEQLDAALRESYLEAQEAGLLLEKPGGGYIPDDDLRERRFKFSVQAFDRMKDILSPQQKELFDKYYDESWFLYRVDIKSPL